MLEGEFTPYYTDLMIVYDTLGEPFDHIGKNKKWNEYFGGLDSIDQSDNNSVNTMITL